MFTKIPRALLGLFTAALLLLSGCASPEKPAGAAPSGDGALTCGSWAGYERFWELLRETCPDIELDVVPYMGANRTAYSWAQLRADDIPDVFITSQIFDQELAAERLADLSGYDFISSFSTSVLDQVAIDGGVYLLPVNYAMYGILYNRTLMEEHGWALPGNFQELEALCGEIREEGLLPGVIGTLLTGNTFSTVFNLAKTGWLTTPEGVAWERDFLAGEASAEGRWEETMDYVQRYIDIGMFHTDPEDRNNPDVVLDYLGHRRSVFCTAVLTLNITELPETGDKIGMMPFISEDGSKNIYMYSPSSYIGISRRLTEPGNEKKLENALRLLSLLYSPEGQAAFITEDTPCVMGVRGAGSVSPDAMIHDAQRALWEGRAFPMTYAGWDHILSDVGQAYKEWFRGENGMDGPGCVARMDELQRVSLNQSHYFCESTADFTLEETAALVGKALGSSVGADAAMIPVGEYHKDGTAPRSSVSGKLYRGKIDTEVALTVCPDADGKYALMTMTGAQAKELARAGLDTGDGRPFPYVLVTRGGGELEDDGTYQVAFTAGGYSEEAGEKYGLREEKGSLWSYVQNWLREQKTVSPGGNPWN